MDLEFLSNYNKRAEEDIKDIRLRYEQILKDKEDLRHTLSESQDELTCVKRQNEELQQTIIDVEEVSKANRKTQKVEEHVAHHFQSFLQDSETKQIIIQLQMKLLAAHEENENMMRQMMKENENMMRQMMKKLNQVCIVVLYFLVLCCVLFSGVVLLFCSVVVLLLHCVMLLFCFVLLLLFVIFVVLLCCVIHMSYIIYI